MSTKRGTRWRVDWNGDGAPERGHLVRHVTATGRCSYVRVVSVRAVRNAKPLPDGCSCRYALVVERLASKPAGEPVSWTCHAYARTKPRPRIADTVGTSADPWSPLL